MDFIKIKDLENLKEGEVYLVDVAKEDQSRVLEALKNWDPEAIADAEAEQVATPLCGTAACNPIVPFCFTVNLPNLPDGTIPITFAVALDASCIRCILEPCLIPNATVANPCTGQPAITGCEVAVNRVTAVGSIRGFLSVVFTPACGRGLAAATTEETFCVDNILCFTCQDVPSPCPNFCTGTAIAITALNVTRTPCGAFQVTVAGNFVLPNCVQG